MAEVDESLDRMPWLRWPRRRCQVETVVAAARAKGGATQEEGGGARKRIEYRGSKLSHRASTTRVVRCRMVSPQGSNSIEQW
jgi:hypothetical protein